jgi:hypothetical protein
MNRLRKKFLYGFILGGFSAKGTLLTHEVTKEQKKTPRNNLSWQKKGGISVLKPLN